ncbi:MAG: cobyric acid synthase [Alphaproteobacteria bacterium]|nr:cobyric acid synthase [Alphaproteobacteria bacterium]
MSALMIQGTGSDVGKSLITAGLCRLFTKRGLKVRPFKPQNMSNNAAVTIDGGEIGRAQALQAWACNIDPSIHMNPVLLKPQGNSYSQIILQGKLWNIIKASQYQLMKSTLMPFVLESFDKLKNGSDLMLVEGAGSPAEVNLREGDIANMGFAEAADLPVILIVDIERGGAIANVVGTYTILAEQEKKRIKGYIINKFCGDQKLFENGIQIIKNYTKLPCLGIIPYFPKLKNLPAEDSLSLKNLYYNSEKKDQKIKIAVLPLPKISNFDDLDPLRMEAEVDLFFVQPKSPLPMDVDMIIIPGSKATILDLQFIIEQGWDIDLKAYQRQGGNILGICGGYQMLGSILHDPNGIEGVQGSFEGIGLLPLETIFKENKILKRNNGFIVGSMEEISGYEIHNGETKSLESLPSMITLMDGQEIGFSSKDKKIFGCYWHGLFAQDNFRQSFLKRIKSDFQGTLKYQENINNILDDWTIILEEVLDISAILKIAR